MRLAPQSALFGNSIAGNLQNDTYTSTGDPAGAQTRFFDAENRMKSARNLSGQNAIYTYDADGRRVRRNSAGQEIWQIYGIDSELLAEYAANSSPASPQKEYGYRSGELLVTAEAATTVPPTTNLALNQTATQSSEGFGGVASRAVDGNTNGDWAAGSSSHTLLDAQPWWQVDLGAVQTIQSIKVWNLTSCCAERMSNFYVLVSDTPFTTTDLSQTLSQPGVSGYYTAGAAGRPTSVAVNRTGRYVRVQLTGANYLHIPEVEVWGTQGQTATAPVSWVVNDHLGTPRMMIDQTGGLGGVRRRDYLPFGEEIQAGVGGRTQAQGYSGTDNVRQKFTGYERDNETGLDYAQARYYSSTMGRYTSVDPIVVTPERFLDPQQFNLYSYTRNNPLRFIDPTGERLIIAGNLDEIKKQLAEILGTDDAVRRITFDEKTGIITVDLKGIDLAKNEGASLLNDVIGSEKVYGLTVGSSVESLGGQLSLIPTKDNAYSTMANLDNNPDNRYSKGKTDKDKPPKGFDDQIGINYDFRNKNSKSTTKLPQAPNFTVTFHELAEAYAKVEHGKQYAQAHQEAIDRETRLRDQRPYLKGYNPGSGPGTSIIIKNK